MPVLNLAFGRGKTGRAAADRMELRELRTNLHAVCSIDILALENTVGSMVAQLRLLAESVMPVHMEMGY